MSTDERYRGQLPTVIASNLTPPRIGGRIGSRLADVRLVTEVALDAADWRRA